MPSRRDDLLPHTLASLRAGGFDAPRLFVDGDNDAPEWRRRFGLETTCRGATLRTFGNWILALWELYLREPTTDRYAIFQDDMITYPGLRQYLDRCRYPERGYWNLYTFPANQLLAPKTPYGGTVDGFYPSNQHGRGAVALVFDRPAVLTLLSSRHMVERPLDPHRGYRAVDGGIVTGLKKEGWTEFVHSPSLTQHTGTVSAMGNKPHQLAESFRGEGWNVMELLR